MPDAATASDARTEAGKIAACHQLIPAPNTMLPTPPMGWSSEENWLYGGRDHRQANRRRVGEQWIARCRLQLRHRRRLLAVQPRGRRQHRGRREIPGGLKGLADYVHGKQLKLGIGSSRGPTTCGGRPGSQDHTAADAATYVAAGVDYVKLDNCNANPADDVRRTQFSAMGTALAGKTIPLSIYPYPAGVDIETFQQWMSTVGQVYRNAGSMSDTFASVVSNVDSNADGVAYSAAAPGTTQACSKWATAA